MQCDVNMVRRDLYSWTWTFECMKLVFYSRGECKRVLSYSLQLYSIAHRTLSRSTPSLLQWTCVWVICGSMILQTYKSSVSATTTTASAIGSSNTEYWKKHRQVNNHVRKLVYWHRNVNNHVRKLVYCAMRKNNLRGERERFLSAFLK